MSMQHDLRKLQANMNKVAKSLVPKAGAAAINGIARKAMKEATGKVAKHIGVPAKTIRSRARNIEKATVRSPKAAIRVNRSNLPALRLFENRSNKMWVGQGGIVIGKYAVQRGFIQTLKNGRTHVMQREGRQRYSIDVVKIPLSGQLTAAFKQSLANYPNDLKKELSARLQAAFVKQLS